MLITICRLVLHDYLFYASREMGRLYETEKYLHNYGLTYALGLASSPFANLAQVPRYQDDLEEVNRRGIYVTPAYPVSYSFAFHTFKMAQEKYYGLTPQISSNQVVYGRAKELAPESTFTFCVLSEDQVVLPCWIRLGKWMAKAHLTILACSQARLKQGRYHVAGALNPLDVATMPDNCNIIAMAPASLITNAYYDGDYYEISYSVQEQQHTACLPVAMRYRPRHLSTSSK
ncbi:MAG: type I-D CRISPR-associated protein Cas5/Csc1 [Ktedonobacteraceae bacterium]|nr:type I-D CRISPR-associated protein Cas5/Csc1 [Ktedonobacteraceae bacterium]